MRPLSTLCWMSAGREVATNSRTSWRKASFSGGKLRFMFFLLFALCSFAFFACVLFFGEPVRLPLRGYLAGGGPAAAHFLCFAKESKQRKAIAPRCPCGVPVKLGSQAGSAKTRLRLRHLRFF